MPLNKETKPKPSYGLNSSTAKVDISLNKEPFYITISDKNIVICNQDRWYKNVYIL